jgi:phosphatidylglycerophosphatase A
MRLSFFEKLLGSCLFSGYLKGPTGTYASFIAYAFYFYIPSFSNLNIILPIIIIFSVYGIFLGDKFENIENKKDPKTFTLDEVVGSWISLIGAPKNIAYISIAFILWRFFDVVKPYPAKKLETLKGGKGIMADDIVSSFYVFISMNFLNLLFKFH